MVKNKKAWLRIFEAFIAVLLILGVLLVIVSKQDAKVNSSEEIINLQRNIIQTITGDEDLRDEIIAGKSEKVYDKVGLMIPLGIGFNVSICEPNYICPLSADASIISDKEIYSSETLVLSNLTSFNDKKLKLFFWRI